MRSASEVEQNIVSVERILHYIELKPEAPWEVLGTVPEDWPVKGEIEFRQYSTRYRPELDLVLKDLNIKIVSVVSKEVTQQQPTFCQSPHEKIGIVGRTGSGKSSVSKVLFSSCGPCSHMEHRRFSPSSVSSNLRRVLSTLTG